MFVLSLPARGAWIEIVGSPEDGNTYAASLPARGAWIEIFRDILASRGTFVAPREGSVDRNQLGMELKPL